MPSIPDPSELPIQIRLFGPVEIIGAPQGERILAQPKLTALLGYLLMAQPRGFHRRDRLLGLFWPDQDSERARGALRTALHALRNALGPDAIQRRGDAEVAVDRAVVWCDADAFDASVSEGLLAQALDLYRGPPLDGVFADSPALEHWLDEQRDAFRAAASDAAWELAQRYETGADLTRAGRWARKAARLASADERRIRRVMELLVRAGDAAGAIAVYEKFAQYLEQELYVEPSSETRELARAIRDRQRAATDT